MNARIHTLLQELENGLRTAHPMQALQSCAQTNEVLKGYMEGYYFRCRKDEILYFKIFKPRFMAHQLSFDLLVNGGSPDSGAVSPWMRRYYGTGETKTDGFISRTAPAGKRISNCRSRRIPLSGKRPINSWPACWLKPG